MSVTFKLRKDANFHDGTPVTAKDVKWSLDRAVTVGGFPTFQMKAGSLEKPEQFVVVDDHTFRVDFLRKDRLTHARPRRHRALRRQLRAGQEERHRRRTPGGSNTPSRTPPAAAPTRSRTGRPAPRSSSSATTTGRAARCRRSSASSGAWCRPPATAARCSSAAMPTSPTTCRTRTSSSCADSGKLTIVSTPYSQRHPVHRHERDQAAVRQSEGARRRSPMRSPTRRSWTRCCSAAASRCSAPGRGADRRSPGRSRTPTTPTSPRRERCWRRPAIRTASRPRSPSTSASPASTSRSAS